MSSGTSLTPLDIATLALLEERPMHPYEMYQTLIQRSEDRVVKVRPGSLYHSVDRLAKRGLLRAIGTEREGNRPERTTYEITEAGQLSLGERISEILGTPVNSYAEFPLGIGEAHNLSLATVIQLLRNRLVLLRADLTVIDEGLRDLRERGIDRRFYLNVEYSKALAEVEIAWVEQLVHDLEAGTLPWPENSPLKEQGHHHNG
jgi:DNA-binding PadR family transcriptional regulator